MEAGIRTPDQRLRVFISSTLGELADERAAARSSVEQLRLTPVMFELGARPHPPRALYRSYLAQSDVFVGIYWQRYGWVAPDMTISGLEDEVVLSDGMPRLVYVKRPAPEMEPRLSDMLTRRLEATGASSYKPFRSAGELRDLLLDDLAVLLTERFDGPRDEAAAARPFRHNLPTLTSTFLGRETEVRDVRELILTNDDVRLVTLNGPGGSGKTRLAIRVATEFVEHFADGVIFVDLSGERDIDGAFIAVSRAADINLANAARPLDAVIAAFRDRKVLLVLDNFEQVKPAAVGVVELLERCPQVKVLVTSREALRVRGERVVPVPPLSLPVDGDAASVSESEAVRLFCDCASAVQPGFQLTQQNAAAISDICRHLDGLPLAIELAAGRVQLFGVDDLLARLLDRVDVLRGGARDLPKRQQTLRDAIAWSYDLLTDDERSVLRLFATFADGRLADIEETAQLIAEMSAIDVIEAVGALVDKNLVRSSPGSDGRPRFSMLHTIRGYAREQRDTEPDFATAVRRAHAQHYSDVASRLHHDLTFVARGEVLLALKIEIGNLRAAWDEWVAAADVGRLNDLLAPLWGYYEARGNYRSAIELGNDLLARLADTPDTPERRGDEFVVRMNLVRTELAVRGFTAEAERMIHDALARAEAMGDARQRFPGLRSLATLHMMRSDFDRFRPVAGELMAIAERESDPTLLTEAHLLTGLDKMWLDDLPSALDHYDKAVKYFEQTRSGFVDFRVGTNPGVVAFVVSGLTQWMVGQPATAKATLQSALDLATSLDHPFSIAYALHHAGLLDLWRLDLAGVAERAAAMLAIAEAHDYQTWRALAFVLGGLAAVGTGVDGGLARVEEGFELYRGLSAPPVFWPALLTMRANALHMSGNPHDGLAAIEQALAALKPGDPAMIDVLIARGDLLLAVSSADHADAEATFERAAQLAATSGARMAQLQALTRLARLRRATPGEADVLCDLRAVYDLFTEGFDSPHLVAARDALVTG